MPSKFYLSDADRRALQDALDVARHRRINSSLRGDDVDEGDPTPALYAAWVGADGIPGAQISGTGTGTYPPETVPGEAEVHVCYVEDGDGVDNVPHLHGADRFNVLVRNLSTDPVAPGQFVLIARDKYGSWWVVGPHDVEAGTGTGTGEARTWARVTARGAGWSHSWVEVRPIEPTAGGFPTNSGESFELVAGGLSGSNNLFERNRHRLPVGFTVEVFPAGDGWVCDADLDHFSADITSETGLGRYAADETYPPDAAVAAGGRTNIEVREFNDTEGIGIGTRILVWVYRVGLNVTYWFDHPAPSASFDCSDCQINLVDIDVTDIVNIFPGTTYCVLDSSTGAVSCYKYVCFGGVCGWLDLCTCAWVSWWCTPRGCVQALTAPADARPGGPYSWWQPCQSACTGTGTEVGTSTSTHPPSGGCSGFVCECAKCPGGAPRCWIFHVSGFTGEWAVLNGDWTLQHDHLCRWFQRRVGGATATLNFEPSTTLVFEVPHAGFVSYRTGASACCLPFDVDHGSGGDGAPDTITLTPSTEICGPCDIPLWWFCVDGQCLPFPVGEYPPGWDGNPDHGPFLTEQECEVSGCLDPGEPGCPDPDVVATLYAHFSCALCGCADGQTFPMTWRPGTGDWRYDPAICGCDGGTVVQCSGDGAWTWESCAGAASGTAEVISYNPVVIRWTMEQQGCPGSTCTVVVDENP